MESSLTYPADVMPLYDDLLSCIRANDQQGVKRVLDELGRARRPIPEILAAIKSLSRTAGSERPHEKAVQSSPHCEPPSSVQDSSPELGCPRFKPEAVTGSLSECSNHATAAITSVLNEGPASNPEIGARQSTADPTWQIVDDQITPSGLVLVLASDSASTETSSKPETEDRAVDDPPDRSADPVGSDALADGEVYDGEEPSLPALPEVFPPSVGRSGAAVLLTLRRRLYAALALILAVSGSGVALLFYPGTENISAAMVRRIDEALTRGKQLSFSGADATDLTDAAAMPSERRSEVFENVHAALPEFESPVPELARPEPPNQMAPTSDLRFSAAPLHGEPAVNESAAADQAETKPALVDPEALSKTDLSEPASPPRKIASTVSVNSWTDQPDVKRAIRSLDALANHTEVSVTTSAELTVPIRPTDEPSIISPVLSRAGPAAPASNEPESKSASVIVDGLQKAVSPPKPAMPGAPAGRSAETSFLVARGDRLFGLGDIVSARLFYERAADAGDGQAALRLGETFDPAFLRSIQLRFIRGDLATAMSWYRRAGDLGASEAHILLNSPHSK